MSSTTPIISIVIPTHNRQASLERLLDKIADQTYPSQMVQVIVVADGCTDDTIEMLSKYTAPFELKYIALPGQGPAVARNRGAELAAGKLLLFLDDDIDPSKELVEAHVAAHKNDSTVVIGYLPFPLSGKADYFKLNLRSWWEQKFHKMRSPSYRYSHEDLLTGNVSLSRNLFTKAGRFSELLRCREDYELGIRLMKEGAAFVFSTKAWGFHKDEVTNLHRSLMRKRQEGKADVQCSRLHPDVTTSLQEAYRNHSYVLMSQRLISFVISYSKLTDKIAAWLEHLAAFAEKLHLRRHWRYLNLKLHNYWYLRGLLDELHSIEALKQYLQHDPSGFIHEEEVALDIASGLPAAEAYLDKARPGGIVVYYGKQEIGRIPYKPNSERLQGRHLRHLLTAELPYSFMKVLAFQELNTTTVPSKFAETETINF